MKSRRYFMKALDAEVTMSLARFCAEQWERFDLHAWRAHAQSDPLTVASTARYLSMTSWYGYEEQLASLSAELFAKINCSSAAGGNPPPPAFNLARLSFATRYLIGRRRRAASAYLLETEAAGSSSAQARMSGT